MPIHSTTDFHGKIQTGSDPAQPVKLDLNEKLDPKKKTIQAFNIDA